MPQLDPQHLAAIQALLANNPDLLQAMNDVLNNQNRVLLGILELVAVVLIIAFRSWRLSKAQHWTQKLFIRAYTSILGIALLSAVLPPLVLGPCYFEALRALVLIFRSF